MDRRSASAYTYRWVTLLANSGDIIDGTVTVSETFGAYVDCDGTEYFIPLHELGWTPLTHATDVVAIGDRITLIVDRPVSPTGNPGPLGSKRRVNPEQNPWRDPSVYAVGTTFVGVVDQQMSYGVLIRHPRNTRALLHTDDFDVDTDTLNVSDAVEVVITECDVDHQKIRVKLK